MKSEGRAIEVIMGTRKVGRGKGIAKREIRENANRTRSEPRNFPSVCFFLSVSYFLILCEIKKYRENHGRLLSFVGVVMFVFAVVVTLVVLARP